VLSERAEAVRNERAARATLDAASTVEREVAGRHAVVLEQFQRHQTALQTLTSRNANQLAEAQRARDEYELTLAAARGASTSIDGKQAAPEALAAVAFALGQRGKPYEWAAEGPLSYDCSGLMLASYLSVGVRLPRVANNQFGAGQPVLASQLLPGDMIFFSTNPYDWRQIHHVAMYIGNNQVVQAPTFGDVVKVSPIWWSEYFGATRIFPAVPIPGATPDPTPAPEPTPTPTATPTPTGTPSPTATPTTPAPTTATPTTAAPTTAAPTTAAPTTTPAGTGTTSPSGSSSSRSAAAAGTPTPSPTPTREPSTPPATTTGTTAPRVASTPRPRRFFRR
jgi:cell wall-associated NlpC family hydrolase